MAKNKSDSTSLILKIVAIVAGVLSFVGMAFKFVAISSRQVSSFSESASMNDWFDWIDLGSDAPEAMRPDWLGAWQTARVFMWIALIAVAVVAVICVLKFFLNMGILNLLMKIAGIVGIVCSLVFIIAMFVGCVQGTTDAISMLPNAGPYVIAIAGLVTSGLGIAVAKK